MMDQTKFSFFKSKSLKKLCVSMIPFDVARTGIVSVPLLNNFSERISDLPGPTLLINFKKTSPDSKSKILKDFRKHTNNESAVNQLTKLNNLVSNS